MQKSEAKVAAIVLNWNSYHLTSRCIKSLILQSYSNTEIVVVDNASADGSGKLLRDDFPEITLIENKSNLGFSGGCNAGIEYSVLNGADYILLFNNDAIAEKELISSLAYVADSSVNCGIVTCGIVEMESLQPWYAGGEYNKWSLEVNSIAKAGLEDSSKCPMEVSFVSGCCMLIGKEVINTVGLLDENFFAYYEDLDYCIRTAEKGFKLIYLPEKLVKHWVSKSFKNERNRLVKFLPVGYYSRMKGKTVLIRKYFKFPYSIIAITVLLSKLLKYLVGFTMTFSWRELRAALSGLKDGCLCKVSSNP